MLIFDLFQVANYTSFTVPILRDAPRGLGNYPCIGCDLKTSLVEGITKMMLVERAAHGFRNDAHRILKIRAAFAEKP